jgi:hypothetical protein
VLEVLIITSISFLFLYMSSTVKALDMRLRYFLVMTSCVVYEHCLVFLAFPRYPSIQNNEAFYRILIMLHVSLAAVSSFGGFVTLVLRMRRAFPACGMIWPLLALVDTHCAQMSSIFLAEFGLRFLWYDVATSSVIEAHFTQKSSKLT